jgi:DHA1 family tetracycline resistance protein-like MFS transporter
VSTLAVFITLIFGFDTLGVSLLLTISGISRAVVRFSVFKPTMRKLGERNMTVLGLSILVVTFLYVGIFARIYPEPWIFIILMILVSYGVSCSRGILISRVTQSVTPREIGKINGYTTTLDSLAQIIGPIMGTFLLERYNPALFGIFMYILALGAFLMNFRVIVPLMQKKQFKLEEQIQKTL